MADRFNLYDSTYRLIAHGPLERHNVRNLLLCYFVECIDRDKLSLTNKAASS
jgi:hypothetical protein